MKLEVYSRRFGHADRYKISKTDEGWHVRHISPGGDCDKTGAPHLFKSLEHDSINYPQDLGGYMEWLWYKSADMSEEEIQNQLDQIGEWIEITEKASPGGIFSEYK